MESIKDTSFEDLEKQWFPLLSKFAGRYIPGFERDDKLQELRIVLWQAQQNYDSERSSFKTFLYQTCSNHLSDINKSCNSAKRRPEKVTVSLEGLEEDVIIIPPVDDERDGIERKVQARLAELSPNAQLAGMCIINNRRDWGLNSAQKEAAIEEIRETFQQEEVSND